MNLLTGHEYVGMTEKGLNKRKTNHLWHAANEPRGRFHRALAKYGHENFKWDVIEVWPDYFSALDAERKIIQILKPIYNMTAGGGGVKGYKHTAGAKQLMSEAKVGRPSVWSKTPMPAHIRERLAECRRAEKGIIKRPTIRRAVIHLASAKEFDSVKEAADAFNTHPSCIVRWCKKNERFAYKDGLK